MASYLFLAALLSKFCYALVLNTFLDTEIESLCVRQEWTKKDQCRPK